MLAALGSATLVGTSGITVASEGERRILRPDTSDLDGLEVAEVVLARSGNIEYTLAGPITETPTGPPGFRIDLRDVYREIGGRHEYTPNRATATVSRIAEGDHPRNDPELAEEVDADPRSWSGEARRSVR